MGRGKGALPACIILIAILYYLMVVLYSIAIALFIAAIICAAVYGCYRFFLSIYFSSQKFAKLKVSIRDNIRDCNELNSHIEELKHSYKPYYNQKLDADVSTFVDKSSWNYQRSELNKYKEANNIYNCSRQVCANARVQPFKYICKYFNIVCNEDSLAFHEDLVNKFSAVEQGKESYLAEREALIESVHTEVPYLIMHFSMGRLYRELGIQPFNIKDKYYPSYQFLYVSSGGNSSLECTMDFDCLLYTSPSPRDRG